MTEPEHQALEMAAREAMLAPSVFNTQPWAWRVLSGAVSPEQLRSNTRAAAVQLPTAVLDELATLAEPADAYWQARSRRPWS